MDSETRVFLDVQIGDYAPKRMVIRLFTDMCPKTCESFRALCTGELGTTRSGHPLFYQDVPFHRVIRRFMMQGGQQRRRWLLLLLFPPSDSIPTTGMLAYDIRHGNHQINCLRQATVRMFH